MKCSFRVRYAGLRSWAISQTGLLLETDDPTNILFVGNSYLYFGDSLHNHVRRMVLADEVVDSVNLKYKSATISGAWLDHHAMLLTALNLLDIKAKRNPRHVQLDAGHASMATTNRYIDIERKARHETARGKDISDIA